MRSIWLIALAAWLFAPAALACSCSFPDVPRDERVRREFLASDVVFSAHVESIHYAEVDGVTTRMARLRVLQSWKGDRAVDTWVDVISDEDSGLMGCGSAVEPDTAILVYSGGRLPIRLVSCSLTGPLDGAARDIPLLNRLSQRLRPKPSQAPATALRDEHIQANVPESDLFATYLQRDLLAYLQAEVSHEIASVAFSLLRDEPTQSGLAYPRFYLWVVATSRDGSERAGAARVAAIDRLRFEISDFVPAQDIRADPQALDSVFPAPLVPAILAKARPE
jgi:hypothetical protein